MICLAGLTGMFQCDNELKYWDGQGGSGPSSRPTMADFLPAQLEAVLMEVKILEDAAMKNEEEIHVVEDGDRSGSSVGAGGPGGPGGPGIRGELDQLKHRLGEFLITAVLTVLTLLSRNDGHRAPEDQHHPEKTERGDEELQHGEDQGEGGGAEGGGGPDSVRD